MRVTHGRAEGVATKRAGDTFTGEVWMDPVVTQEEGVAVNAVTFTPGAHTHWHTDEHGQVLQVTTGQGWVCADGEEPQPIRTGDTVWVSPGERHWHGAASTTLLTHVAVSLGETAWQEAVGAAYPAGDG